MYQLLLFSYCLMEEIWAFNWQVLLANIVKHSRVNVTKCTDNKMLDKL